MRRLLGVVAAALMLSVTPELSRAGDNATAAGALLYMERPDWRAADPAQKAALAVDFMRIYCGDPAMPAADLVACLDQVGDPGSMFARALSCVADWRTPNRILTTR